MSKLSVMKGTTSSIQDAPYTEGQVYFLYEGEDSEYEGDFLSIYADIDGSRYRISGIDIEQLKNVEISNLSNRITPLENNDAGYLTLATLPIYDGTVI